MVHGKSTLARLISGLEMPTTGEILVDEINTRDKKKFLDLRKKIGIVFQNPENQIIFDKVYDDIAFGLKNLNETNYEDRIIDSLEKVGMEEHTNSNPYDLSLGQKQRIAIAAMLAMKPKTIIFDEPTAMLDPNGKKEVRKVIKDLQLQGYTIIYLTNIIDEILLADRVITLESGKIIKEIRREEVINKLKENGLNFELKETIENAIEKIVGG